MGNSRVELPDVGLRNYNVFGKRSVGIHTDDLYVLADVRFSGAALHALATSDMHLCGNEVAFFYARDFIAECDDLAAELVPRNEWRVNAALCPAIPLIDVQVSAADGRYLNLHQHIGAAEARNLNFANLRSRRGFRLYDGQHGVGHA